MFAGSSLKKETLNTFMLQLRFLFFYFLSFQVPVSCADDNKSLMLDPLCLSMFEYFVVHVLYDEFSLFSLIFFCALWVVLWDLYGEVYVEGTWILICFIFLSLHHTLLFKITMGFWPCTHIFFSWKYMFSYWLFGSI